MIKNNSKKMSKMSILFISIALLVVAVFGFYGTYAYFTSKTSAISGSNVEIGKVALKGKTTTVTAAASNVVPGADVYTTSVAFANDSTVSTFVVVSMSFKITPVGGAGIDAKDLKYGTAAASAKPVFTISGLTNAGESAAGWVQVGNDFVYANKTNDFVIANSVKDITFLSNGKVTFDQGYGEQAVWNNTAYTYTLTGGNKLWNGSTELTGKYLMGATVKLSFTAYQIQATNLEGGTDVSTADKVITFVKGKVS